MHEALNQNAINDIEGIFSSPSKQPKSRRRNLDLDYLKLMTSQKARSSFKSLTISSFLTMSILLSFTVLSYTGLVVLLENDEVLSNEQSRQLGPQVDLHSISSTKISKSSNEVNSLLHNHTNETKLDFIMGGFPKTGSTSILHLFRGNNETNVLAKEFCSYSSEDNVIHMQRMLDKLDNKSKDTKRGIKCPMALWNAKGLRKLNDINKDIKIIVGVRHPVLWFESFYNYRVTEMHDKNAVIVPPLPQQLVAPNHWKGVSTLGPRFEIALMQLGKASLSTWDLTLLRRFGTRKVIPNSFKIFIYDIDQLSDTSIERSHRFKNDVQDFLNLKHPIRNFPRSNINHFTGENKYPETIDICEAKYDDLRLQLTQNGRKTSEWIRSKFIDHNDVLVGGKGYFLDLIDEWGKDPCSKKDIRSDYKVDVRVQ